MSATLEDAIALAAKHFAGITDKSGQPYILHCIRVMMGVDSLDAKMIGVMHDLVEDTSVTLDDLRSQGFSDSVVRGVDRMTHRSETSYQDYVIRLRENELARQVKLSDLRDNLSLDRVLLRGERFQRDLARVGKYVATYRFLTDEIDEAAYRGIMERL
ncbi:Bifunctional (p)ppGpp synthase/hydrolase RelA [Stieleria neptunia]|uniref:Bifunctional (P)ppGpp synthase/hydrolase RelA n=1 Tax=Stieleria neptunia TaxID=2527979 RepID=A0A518HYU8_9BACT|nr:HD domain-containing protein [Stieleria neptunia]QDV46025.1 Bifunctional (p)ppGpp synthase/hydrolase RelA [Stieleria neptunia]